MKKISYTPITNEDAVWAGAAYGHLVELGETISGKELAKRIRGVYDCKHSKNKLAAYFAEYGLEKISTSKTRDGRLKRTWFAVDDVMLRTNEGVYKRIKLQEEQK